MDKKIRKKNNHAPYEFVMENDQSIVFTGNSVQEIFNGIIAYFNIPGDNFYSKSQLLLANWQLESELPESGNVEFFEELFFCLQRHLIGTWRWYGDLYNEEYWYYAGTLHRYKVSGYKLQNENKARAERREKRLARKNNPQPKRDDSGLTVHKANKISMLLAAQKNLIED